VKVKNNTNFLKTADYRFHRVWQLPGSWTSIKSLAWQWVHY